MRPRAWICLLSLALLGLASVGSARADWPTYHGDGARSGVDHSTAAAAPFAAGWTSTDLGGDIYAEPLVSSGLVYVATEGNDVYALSAASGQVAWHQRAGAPVPSNKLGCGNISPTVGITSTPVLDTARNLIFVVADTWDGAAAHHVLVTYRASDGAPAFSQNVDPPGTHPLDQLQRPGLAIAGGQVLIGFGGNWGDCGTYWGWMVSASESGPAAPHFWQAAPSDRGAAIWQGGGAPAIDASGSVYATTGNATNGPSSFDHSETIEKFDALANELDYFASPTWMQDNSADADLGSAAPQLLDGGLIFQAGKNGNGYLVRSVGMGQQGPPAYQASACTSYGADAYASGTIFVACSDGIRAMTLNADAPSFKVAWHGPNDAKGPPIVAGGLVWLAAYDGGKLYGLDPASGSVRVSQSVPAMTHFATPSACDGRLYLATNHTVEQFTIGTAVSPPACAAAGAPPAPPPPPEPKPSCAQIALRIRHPHLARVVRVTVFVAGKKVATFHGRNLRRVSVKAGDGAYAVRLVEWTSRHRRLTYRLRFAGCKRLR